jgi:hypothetical protein
VAGAIGVLAGFPLADPIVGLLITVAILVVLRGAARDIYRRIMDAVDPHLVDAAEASLRSVPGVHDVEDLRLRWIGHRIRAETGLAVDARLSLAEAHRIAHEAQHRLLHDVPRLSDATVHVSPAAQEGLAAHEAVAHHGLPAGRPAETGHRHQDDAGAHGHRHPDNAGAHGHRHPDPSHGHARIRRQSSRKPSTSAPADSTASAGANTATSA